MHAYKVLGDVHRRVWQAGRQRAGSAQTVLKHGVCWLMTSLTNTVGRVCTPEHACASEMAFETCACMREGLPSLLSLCGAWSEAAVAKARARAPSHANKKTLVSGSHTMVGGQVQKVNRHSASQVHRLSIQQVLSSGTHHGRRVQHVHNP